MLAVAAGSAMAVFAFPVSRTLSGAPAAAGLALLLSWLVLFAGISARINRMLVSAALANDVPAHARHLQARWESIITLRAGLQGTALALFCAAIAAIAR